MMFSPDLHRASHADAMKRRCQDCNQSPSSLVMHRLETLIDNIDMISRSVRRSWKQSRALVRAGAFLFPLVIIFIFVRPALASEIELRRSAEASPTRILRMGIPSTGLKNLDPHRIKDENERIVADLLFNGLLRYTPGQAPSIEPDLAECFPVPVMRRKHQTWTVHLRRGVRFHPFPGTEPHELTADDVVFSLKRAADPRRSVFAGDYEGMTFLRVNDHTVEIICETPYTTSLFYPLIADYGGGVIVSKKAYESLGESFLQDHPTGTGPFRLDASPDRRHLKLLAHDTYFRGLPHLEGVELFLTPDILMLEHKLRDGRLDIIRGIDQADWIRSMSDDDNLAIDIHGVGGPLVFHFNTRMPPLDNLLVRRAIAHALDRDTFVRAIGQSIAAPLPTPIPARQLTGGMTKDEVAHIGLLYPRDLQEARDLLNNAGYPEGFRLDLTSSRLHYPGYLSFKEQLAEIDIECSIRIIDHVDSYRDMLRKTAPVVLSTAFRPHTDGYLTDFFHSRSIPADKHCFGDNVSRYQKIDHLIDAARRETDPEIQKELWKHCQIMILNDMAAYPACIVRTVHVRNRRLDYGHPLEDTLVAYPQFTEKTRIALPGE